MNWIIYEWLNCLNLNTRFGKKYASMENQSSGGIGIKLNVPSVRFKIQNVYKNLNIDSNPHHNGWFSSQINDDMKNIITIQMVANRKFIAGQANATNILSLRGSL